MLLSYLGLAVSFPWDTKCRQPQFSGSKLSLVGEQSFTSCVVDIKSFHLALLCMTSPCRLCSTDWRLEAGIGVSKRRVGAGLPTCVWAWECVPACVFCVCLNFPECVSVSFGAHRCAWDDVMLRYVLYDQMVLDKMNLNASFRAVASIMLLLHSLSAFSSYVHWYANGVIQYALPYGGGTVN